MTITSQSLLEQLQKKKAPRAWERLMAVYEPWLRGWLGRHQLQAADADDLVQNILAVVNQKLPAFVHNGRAGAFRTWLRTILTNQVRNFLRTRRHQQSLGAEPLSRELEQLEDPRSDACRAWDLEHDQVLVRRLLAVVQPEFPPQTWEIFRLLVLQNQPAADVAQQCRVPRNGVYVAKFRVLARLRQELRGLMES